MNNDIWTALVYIAFLTGTAFGAITAVIIMHELKKCEVKVDHDNEVTYVGTYFERGKEKTIDISATNYKDACRKFREFLLSVDSGMSFVAYKEKLEVKE